MIAGLVAVLVAMIIERTIADLLGIDVGYLVLIGTIPYAVVLGGLPAGVIVVIVGGLTHVLLSQGPPSSLPPAIPPRSGGWSCSCRSDWSSRAWWPRQVRHVGGAERRRTRS